MQAVRRLGTVLSTLFDVARAVHATRCVNLRVSERASRGHQDGCRLDLCPLDTEELESIDTWARGALRFVM
jgi:hypothetical protein